MSLRRVRKLAEGDGTMADQNSLNVVGSYSGTVTVNGPVFIGYGNSVDGGSDGPVLIAGSSCSASSSAPYSVVFGNGAKSTASMCFVFNGKDIPYAPALEKGQVAFNPASGMDGFYIGSTSIGTTFKSVSSNVIDMLNTPGRDNNIVHLGGGETVTGLKTFAGGLNTSSNNGVEISGSSILFGSVSTIGL